MRFYGVLEAIAALFALASCQLNPQANGLSVSAFHPGQDANGYQLLWEANERRCQRIGSSFRDCQYLEWQTPLYNQGATPKALRILIQSPCQTKTPLRLTLAIAPRPATMRKDGEQNRVEAPLLEQDFELKGGETSTFSGELPPQSQLMLIAMVQAFPKQYEVNAPCRILFRFEETRSRASSLHDESSRAR